MKKIGKYEVVRELGSGATSTVYLAIDPFSGQQVAVKLFDLGILHDPSRAKVFRKLLMTEASLAGKLSIRISPRSSTPRWKTTSTTW